MDFLKTFVILTSKVHIIKQSFLISFHTAYHVEKNGLKIIRRGYRTENDHASPLAHTLLPCAVMGIVELLSFRNAAGCECLLFNSAYDSGTVQWMYFVVLTLLTHLCNFSKCYLKLVLLLAAANYTKAFLVNCEAQK